MKNRFALVLFGGLMLAGSAFAWSRIQPYDDGVVTTGVVTREIVVRGSDGNTYKPEIRFMTQDGQQIVFVPGSSTSSRVQVGDELRISYRPDAPHSARNLDAPGQWLIYLFGGLGILLIAFAAKDAITGETTDGDVSLSDSTNRTGSEQVSHWSGTSSGDNRSEMAASVAELDPQAQQTVASVMQFGNTVARFVALTRKLGAMVALCIFGIVLSATGGSNPIFAIAGGALLLGSIAMAISVIKTIRSWSARWTSGATQAQLTQFAGQMRNLAESSQNPHGPEAPTQTTWQVDPPNRHRPPAMAAPDPTLGGTDPFDT